MTALAAAILIGVVLGLVFALLCAQFPGFIILFDPGAPESESRTEPAAHSARSLLRTLAERPITAEMFTPDECASILQRVLSLKARWQTKSIGGVMKTCGRPSYLGAATAGSGGVPNAEMQSIFDDVYERIREYFSARCPRTDVVIGGGDFSPAAGVPGFHIFAAGRAFEWPVASLHVDKQYLDAGLWPRNKPAPRKTLSFTILIQEPEGGAGLHVWNVSGEDNVPALGGHARGIRPFWLLANARKHHHVMRYRLGAMTMHCGHLFHMIAPNSKGATRDRITLQGHGIFLKHPVTKRRTLVIYW